MIELAWVPFALMFLVFCAWVAENYPRHNPFDEETWERRHQEHEHFRR